MESVPFNVDIERYVNELAVGSDPEDRGRTYGDGTMDNTLLQDHGVGTEGLLRATATLSRIGA